MFLYEWSASSSFLFLMTKCIDRLVVVSRAREGLGAAVLSRAREGLTVAVLSKVNACCVLEIFLYDSPVDCVCNVVLCS